MKRGIFTSSLAILVCLFLFSGCNWDPMGISEPWQNTVNKEPCNGASELCDMAYDEVVYPSTHYSYSYDLGVTQFFQPHQEYPVRRQLLDGVRAVTLEISEYEGDIVVMHENEAIRSLLTPDIYANLMGHESASRPLGEIKEFLDNNPREIITLFIESELSASELEAELARAELTPHAHVQTDANWPTLEEMIDNEKRLVIFTNNIDAASSVDHFHYTWLHARETNRNISDADDFDCDLEQGNATNELVILNHYVVPLLGGGSQGDAETVNEFEFLLDRTVSCWQATGQKPNFINIDLYRTGDLFTVCDSLNRMETP